MRKLITIVATALAAVPLLAMAQSPQAPSPPAAAAQPYRPGLGDLMTMTVQPRHIKIALAGREKNWAYAKYELHVLEEALQRVVQVWPRWRGLPLGGMVEAIGKGPMAAVATAIEAKDAEKFAAAMPQLTEGCNACHQAANVGLVVIKTPDASSFPDQDFRPSAR
jgi:hypothetical protein